MRPTVKLSFVQSVSIFFVDRGLTCTGIYPGGKRGSSKVVFGYHHEFYSIMISPPRTDLLREVDDDRWHDNMISLPRSDLPREVDDDRRYDNMVRTFRRRLRGGKFKFPKEVLRRCEEADKRRRSGS